MLRLSLIISSLLQLTTLCSAQVSLAPYAGKWESEEDVKNRLVITDKTIVELYGTNVIDTFLFTITYQACDTGFKPTTAADSAVVFLYETSLHQGHTYCYQVLRCDDEQLVLLFTHNEYEAVFRRRK